MKLLKGKKGFTLIELVVVIAILGILAGIAIPRFLDATATARGSKIVADMRTIDSAIVIYNAKTGKMVADVTTAVGAPELLSDSTDGSKYKLLAAWPVPPTGDAIVTLNSGIASTKASVTTKFYGVKDGRATLGTQTVDAILKDGITAQ